MVECYLFCLKRAEANFVLVTIILKESLQIKRKYLFVETKQIHNLLKMKSNHKIKCITQWKLKQVQRIFIVEIISQYLDGCMKIIRIFVTLQAAYKGNLKYLESLSHQGRCYSLFKGSNEPRDFTKIYIYIYIIFFCQFNTYINFFLKIFLHTLI